MFYHYTKLDDDRGADGEARFQILNAFGRTVCIVDSEDTARLFSAASSLLDALEALLADDMSGMSASAIKEIEEGSLFGDALYAIAKAKGGAA